MIRARRARYTRSCAEAVVSEGDEAVGLAEMDMAYPVITNLRMVNLGI
ncbi:hypothetical protein MED193_12047 [Roseobacter sp. MED193]|nr:hypothetical protein MED193_12047 [Roseobacter sp. MED193]